MPDYERVDFADGGPRSRYCLSLFVINEGGRLLSQLERMAPWVEGVDVVVADGGSTDGSVTEDNLRPRGVSTALVKRGAGRLGAQLRMAFDFALEEGYEGIVVMDGNDKDGPEGIPRFLEALEAGYDHVQGSRFVRGGREINTPWWRKMAVRWVHAPAIRAASGYPYTDTTNGFRAYSRSLLEDPGVAPFRSEFSGYELHYYLAVRAARLGFRVCEVPVTRAYPATGPTPTKISPVRGNLGVLRALCAVCAGKYDP
ncbi:MAG: glycosyltransferase family 2 protein [Halobacteriales archaeon]|nr:glycosyltransferase family 2 protein [Halobacteriales archaeon]